MKVWEHVEEDGIQEHQEDGIPEHQRQRQLFERAGGGAGTGWLAVVAVSLPAPSQPLGAPRMASATPTQSSPSVHCPTPRARICAGNKTGRI
jgi:hypothetical protein